jgi:hypothetical protein
MINQPRHLALFAVIAAGLLPATCAQAQYYGTTAQSAPLHPHAVQAHHSYAVELAPNTYRIRRPAPARSYPYVGQRGGHAALNRPHKKVDRALIEELHGRKPLKRSVINSRNIVPDAPVAVETRRVVERHHFVADRDIKKRVGRDDSKKRVIQADAEITIHGPDRMSIRLFRKGHGSKASARVD